MSAIKQRLKNIKKAVSEYGKFRAYKKSDRKVTKKCRELGVKTQHDFPADRTRASETLFVLGSGGSINELTEAQWRQIRGSDSCGINFWHLHPHVPNYYIYEFPYQMHPHRSESMLHNHAVLRDRYASSHIIAKGDLENLRRDSLFGGEHYYYFNPMNGPRSLVHGFRLFDLLGLFARRSRLGHSFQWRSTVSFAIFMAVVLGYKEIVLCGVDLNDTRYFFEEPEFQEKHLDPELMVPQKVQNGQVHTTNDPEKRSITVSDIMYFLHERLLPQKGIKLYVGSEQTALFPRIPVYFSR